MSQTECVEKFTSHGREFMVLHKDSAAYLRAEGRMIASLGDGLSIEEAIAAAHLQAELFQIKEREQEAALMHRLYEMPLPEEIKAIAADYELLKFSPAGDGAYAPFNHNGYAHTAQGWEFIGCFESAQEFEAKVAQMQVSGALMLAKNKRANKWLASFKSETKVFAVIVACLAVLLALAYGVQQAFSRWPMILPLLMGAVFIGCAVLLWKKK
jgi:hypothetical protein